MQDGPANPDPGTCDGCGDMDFIWLGDLADTSHWRCRYCHLECETDCGNLELPNEIPREYAED
jgi:hypothetical protein